MSKRKRIYKPGGTYFITSTTHERKTYFSNIELARLLVDQSFYHYEDKLGFQIVAFTVQPDHYHLLLTVGCKMKVEHFISHSISRDIFLLTSRLWEIQLI